MTTHSLTRSFNYSVKCNNPTGKDEISSMSQTLIRQRKKSESPTEFKPKTSQTPVRYPGLVLVTQSCLEESFDCIPDIKNVKKGLLNFTRIWKFEKLTKMLSLNKNLLIKFLLN